MWRRNEKARSYTRNGDKEGEEEEQEEEEEDSKGNKLRYIKPHKYSFSPV